MKSDSPLRAAISARLRLPAAMLLLALTALLLPESASADIALDARIGFGQSQSGSSRYRPGSWTPVTIYLTGQGARGVGQLTVTVRQSGHTTAYTRKISLHDGPLNEAYNFVFDFRPVNYGMMGGNTTLEVSAQLVLDGRELANRRFALPLAVNEETFNVLALTRDGSGMNFLAKKKLGLIHRGVNPSRLQNRFGGGGGGNTSSYSALEQFTSAALLYTDPRALPGMSQGYAMIDAVALADQPLDNLTEDQSAALQSYVRDGGLLVISGGGDLSRLKSQFYQEMLPITPTSAVAVRGNAPELAALEARYHEPLGLKDSVALTVGTPRPGAITLFGPAKGTTGFGLIAARPYGAGYVVFTAFDFLAPEFRGWKQTPSLWRDILRSNNQALSPRGILSNMAHFGAQSGNKGLVDAMAGKQASSTPGFPIVATFLGAYLFLLIPASYLLLKKLDKRELAWFTAPGLILGFTVLSYLIALSIKGAALTINRVVVLEAQANTDQIAGYGQMTIYSPRRAGYDIALGPQGDAGRAYRAAVPAEIFEINSSALGDMTIEHDQTTKIRGAEVRLWDKRSFDCPVVTSLGGPVEIKTIWIEGDRVQVTVTNKTRRNLQNCALVTDKGQTIDVGSLAAGEKKRIETPLIWAYRESSTSVHLPSAPADWQYSPSINNRTPQTAEQVRNNLRFALTQALTNSGTNSNTSYQNFSMNGDEDVQTFGKATNAFVAWVEPSAHPLLDLQVDGKPGAGEEATLLYIHLPPASNFPPAMAKASNPFLLDPILNLKEESPGPAGRVVQ